MLRIPSGKTGALAAAALTWVALLGAACSGRQAVSSSVLAGSGLEQPHLAVADAQEAPPSAQLISLVDAKEAAGGLSPASLTLCKQDDPKVYLVTDNQRRHIVDWDTFLNLGFKQEQIVPCGAMASYAEGASITRLLKGSADPVYWMEGGYRRHVPNMQTFYSLGFQVNDISIVSDTLLNAWPLGRPLPSAPGHLTAQTECSGIPADRGWVDGPTNISPNKKWIGFSSNPNGDARLYILKRDGSARTRIDAPDKAFPLTSPVWSPDSRYMAFINVFVSQPGGGRIYVAKADGSEPVKVAEYVGYFDKIAWSPDGKQIAFTSGTAIGHGSGTNVVEYKIYTVTITSPSQPQLALDGCSPVWAP